MHTIGVHVVRLVRGEAPPSGSVVEHLREAKLTEEHHFCTGGGEIHHPLLFQNHNSAPNVQL